MSLDSPFGRIFQPDNLAEKDAQQRSVRWMIEAGGPARVWLLLVRLRAVRESKMPLQRKIKRLWRTTTVDSISDNILHALCWSDPKR